MKVGRILFVLATLLQPIFAEAADRDIAIKGPGNVSCGTWVRDHQDQDHIAEKIVEDGWLMGFITAVNTFKLKETSDIAQGTDAEGMLAWITTYCRAHPLESVFEASVSLIVELAKKGGAH